MTQPLHTQPAFVPSITLAHTRIGGLAIHHASAGVPGRPLLLFLHGFPEFWFAWEKQLLDFGRDYFAVAPDTRGINLSDKPTRLSDYQARNIVADVAGLVEALGYRDCVLVGHDWGGALAYAMAIARPDKVRRLVILNAVHPLPFARELVHSQEQARASDYIGLFRRPDAANILRRDNCAWLRSMFDDENGKCPGWFDAPTQARYIAAWSQPGALDAGLNYYRASPLHPPGASDPGAASVRLDPATLQVTMPTLVLWGERDRFLLTGCLDGLRQVVPDLTVHRFAQSGHWIAHEEPQAVNRLIRDFLVAPRPGPG